MPLIEKLLADLIKTTEGFQSIKVKNSEMIKEIENLKNLVEPLRIENSKTIKENNELHYELIRIKEDKDLNSNKSLVAINKLDHETSDLKFILNTKESLIQSLESELSALKIKFESLANKTSTGLKAPVHPKIISSGQFSQKDLPSMNDKNGSVAEDWATELRHSDAKGKQIMNKLEEQLQLNNQISSDLSHAKTMIESRDKEINRLSMLYESNINLDKINLNYSLEKLQKQNDNLQKQLEFMNSENNKLATMHKENMTMSESFKSNTNEVKRMNAKLLNKEEEIIRLKQSVESKTEQVKRLTEQWNSSQKPGL